MVKLDLVTSKEFGKYRVFVINHMGISVPDDVLAKAMEDGDFVADVRSSMVSSRRDAMLHMPVKGYNYRDDYFSDPNGIKSAERFLDINTLKAARQALPHYERARGKLDRVGAALKKDISSNYIH
tara:strand:+ start:80 stop:454 length:375 start_codon:yes stop_codon:yes gene_type:complete